MNNSNNCDVLIIFFNRPEPLKKVFESVRQAKPRRLFLAQDGARESKRETDEAGIRACREIVSKVDWPCEVLTNYSEKNLTCDEREFSAISWAFQYTDRLIILEDDCVPCPSFYPMCDYLLEKYKDDERIQQISGFNRLEDYHNYPYDYMISTVSAGYGWATWKRVWDEVEKLHDLDFLDDHDYMDHLFDDAIRCMDKSHAGYRERGHYVRQRNRELQKTYSWEYAFGIQRVLSNSLVITPRKNMVQNIGTTVDSTHTNELELQPKRLRRIFTMGSYDVRFPLYEPPFVTRNLGYEAAVEKSYYPGFVYGQLEHVEAFYLKLKYWGLRKTLQWVRTKL